MLSPPPNQKIFSFTIDLFDLPCKRTCHGKGRMTKIGPEHNPSLNPEPIVPIPLNTSPIIRKLQLYPSNRNNQPVPFNRATVGDHSIRSRQKNAGCGYHNRQGFDKSSVAIAIAVNLSPCRKNTGRS